jgi:membrane protease YdiL (CAAX protease family)
LSTIIYFPLTNFFNEFFLNAKYGQAFSITSLLSALTFCFIYLFIKKHSFKKIKISIFDLKIISLSFLFPILITFSIFLIQKTVINFNYLKIDIFYLFISFFIYALMEEIICRFAMINISCNTNYIYVQIMTSSLFFSLLHFGNNSYGLIPFIVLFLSGIILSIIYIKTNLLTVAIVHTLWNTSSSIVMGGNVSGIKVNYSLFSFIHFKNNIINGGGFGIEGSLITLIILLTICLIMFFKIHTLIILDEQN